MISGPGCHGDTVARATIASVSGRVARYAQEPQELEAGGGYWAG